MKKIIFLTGTRADFGKLKSLITKVEESDTSEAYVFVTGMHMLSKYGMTAREVEKSCFGNIYKYINQSEGDSMDIVLAKTICGLSDYVKEIKPDLIIIHGDRVEALAGAIVGSLNNVLVSHIEGGEVSGTIDEIIRHSVTKMSHLHFVCNGEAKNRLIQLGESNKNIYEIGSPDLDIMCSSNLPTLEDAKDRYQIDFDEYSIFMYHPVTTDVRSLNKKISVVVDALIKSNKNYIVIYPNNDHGTNIILSEIKRLESNKQFKIFPSIRFEYFLTLLKNAKCIVGNSSAGIREAPFYGVPTVDLGTRQQGRSSVESIINVVEEETLVLEAITNAYGKKVIRSEEFGKGNSADLFIEAINRDYFWKTELQKTFIDIKLAK